MMFNFTHKRMKKILHTIAIRFLKRRIECFSWWWASWKVSSHSNTIVSKRILIALDDWLTCYGRLAGCFSWISFSHACPWRDAEFKLLGGLQSEQYYWSFIVCYIHFTRAIQSVVRVARKAKWAVSQCILCDHSLWFQWFLPHHFYRVFLGCVKFNGTGTDGTTNCNRW